MRKLLGVLLALSLLTGCGGNTQPSAAGSRPLKNVKVIISAITFAQVAVLVAKDAGIFERNGLNPEITLTPDGTPALLAGDVRILVSSPEESILANTNGANLAIVATLVRYLQQKFIVRPEIKTAADLKGKTVGVTKRGTIIETVARMVAKQGGLDPDKDITILELNQQAASIAALSNGSIYGQSLLPPFTDQALKLGMHVLYDPTADKVEYPTPNVIVGRAWAAQNQDVVLGFLRSLAEAVPLLHEQPDYVAEIFSRWAKTTVEESRGPIKLGAETVQLKMTPTAKGIRFVQDELALRLPAVAAADPARFYDDSFIKKLEAEGFYEKFGRDYP